MHSQLLALLPHVLGLTMLGSSPMLGSLVLGSQNWRSARLAPSPRLRCLVAATNVAAGVWTLRRGGEARRCVWVRRCLLLPKGQELRIAYRISRHHRADARIGCKTSLFPFSLLMLFILYDAGYQNVWFALTYGRQKILYVFPSYFWQPWVRANVNSLYWKHDFRED